MKSKVSIILVNYNGFKDTVECINSLRYIDYINYDIIVVDNDSEKDYDLLSAKYSDSNVTVLSSESNLGFSGGNNIGISYARNQGADYILLLNNDTLVENDFLTYMVSTAQKLNNRCVITSKIMYAYDKERIWYAGGKFDFKTSRTSVYGINEIDSEKYNHAHHVSFASGCCLLIPINILDDIGLMDEDYFLYCEDTDYCLRILKAGYEIIYEPKSKIFHKVNASTKKIAGIQTYYLVRNKLFIVKKYIEKNCKISAYSYVFMETAKRILTREYEVVATLNGIKDFIKGIKGKR